MTEKALEAEGELVELIVKVGWVEMAEQVGLVEMVVKAGSAE